jgi:hypothetical protein
MQTVCETLEKEICTGEREVDFMTIKEWVEINTALYRK